MLLDAGSDVELSNIIAARWKMVDVFFPLTALTIKNEVIVFTILAYYIALSRESRSITLSVSLEIQRAHCTLYTLSLHSRD